MNKFSTTLSVCIPTFNRKEILIQNIKHLIKIGNSKIQLVISDNCSTDGTSNYVKKLLCESPSFNIIYSRNQTNLGPDLNFKKALSLATGKYSLLLGDDDFLSNDFFLKVLPLLEVDETFSAVFLSQSKSDTLKVQKFNSSQIVSFLKTVGVGITFMSSLIFNTLMVQKTIEKGFCYQPNLIQASMFSNVIISNPCFNSAIIKTNIFGKTGKISATTYNYFDVFVVNLYRFYSGLLLQINQKQKTHSLYRKSCSMFLIKFFVLIKANHIPFFISKNSKTIMKKYLFYWVGIIPINLIPGSFFSFLLHFKKRKK
jgi:glycosyltransferase involved in cell wall biosynthesis